MKYKFARNRRAVSKCPCGRHNRDGKFSPFLIDGKPSPQYGYCHSCAKTMFPEQSPDEKPEAYVPPPPPPLKFIPRNQMDTSPDLYERNPLATWLVQRLGEEVRPLLQAFHLGTTPKGAASFWYVDMDGRVRNCKHVHYRPDGRRDKSRNPFYRFRTAQGYRLCLFGEHQLAGADRTIGLVESEKTAIICTALLPRITWLATGGAGGLTTAKAEVLRDRSVILFPDCDQAGRKGMERAAKILDAYCCKVRIHDPAPHLDDGSDLADILLGNTNPSTIYNQIKPHL